jgi:hypothetical protein
MREIPLASENGRASTRDLKVFLISASANSHPLPTGRDLEAISINKIEAWERKPSFHDWGCTFS